MFLSLTSCSFHLRNAHECFCSLKAPPTFTSRGFDWLLVWRWEPTALLSESKAGYVFLTSWWFPKACGCDIQQGQRELAADGKHTNRWNVLNLSPQRSSDGSGPEVIFHSVMCVSGGKQRWVFFYSSLNIQVPCCTAYVWSGLHTHQLHCFIEAQCHWTPAESSVPVYLIIWNPFIETGQIWFTLGLIPTSPPRRPRSVNISISTCSQFCSDWDCFVLWTDCLTV